MLGCHIELVARLGWQAAGCVFLALEVSPSEKATLAGRQADVGMLCWHVMFMFFVT